MKKLACLNTHAEYPEDAIEQFNDQREKLGLTSEQDLVSVSVLPAVTDIHVAQENGPSKKSLYEVVFVYWTIFPE